MTPGLFIVPYLDEDVDADLIALLRKQGYEAYSVHDFGMLRRSGLEPLVFASERGWTLVTHNVRHFVDLHNGWMQEGKDHAGIVVSKRMEIGRMLDALLNVFDHVSADAIRNQVLYLQNFE